MPNDYLNALNAYDKTNKGGLTDPREIEVRALFKAADSLENLKNNWDTISSEEKDDILRRNEKLWIIFTAEMEKDDTGLDMAIRNNIANLGVFTFKRTLDIRLKEEPRLLDVLISINRNIASGLQESIAFTKKQQETSAPAPQSDSTPQTPELNSGDFDFDI